MSSDFKKVLVKDDRLMVTDSLNYAVYKGGQNVVSLISSKVAESTSSVTFNTQIPSEQTIVDRHLFLDTSSLVTFTTTNAVKLVYGNNISLAPFPFQQGVTSTQTTINNNVTSIYTKDVLPFILRSNDSRDLQKGLSSCPTMADKLANYADGLNGPVGQNPYNVLGNFTNSVDSDILSNGAYAGFGSALPGGPLATIQSLAQEFTVTLFYFDGANYVAQNPITPVASSTWALAFQTVEPVICQPFIFSNPVSNKQGIYGLQTIQLQFNLGDANRVFRCSGVDYISNVATAVVVQNARFSSIRNSKLIYKFLTPHPSDLMPARNVIPLLTYDRYFSTALNTVLPAKNKTTVSSNTYNLTQIPDKICVFFRKKLSLQSPTDPDVSPVITNISINFNNNSGILASSTVQDLYRYSVEAGSNQSYQEFIGQAYGKDSAVIPTIGSYLMLDFATVINLIEDYYAPGSLGNFQLQFNTTIFNQTNAQIDAGALEMVLVVINSGVMVTERGQTSTYTGILTKQDVLDASQQTPLSITDVTRIVGSGHQDRGRALPLSVKPMLPGSTKQESKKSAEAVSSRMNERLM